jgi:hypothetical protein
MSGDSVRVSVSVAVPPPVAYEIFTGEIDRWWGEQMNSLRHACVTRPS